MLGSAALLRGFRSCCCGPGALVPAARLSGLAACCASASAGAAMSSRAAAGAEQQGSGEQKPKKKICCACPETKKLRDECVVEHGEAACAKWIEAHKRCLRQEGFNV